MGGGGDIQILRRNFFSHGAENFVGESFTVALISGIVKVWIRRRGVSRFSIEKICLTVPKLFVGESFTVALNSCIEKVWIRGGGGESRFSVENFLSHSAENFRRRILYCCTKFGYRKSLEKRGGEVQHFLSKIFCLTLPKDSVGESFTVALVSGS